MSGFRFQELEGFSQVSGVSAAADLKSGQFNLKRNFVFG